MENDMPRFGGDDQIDAIFNFLAEEAVERFGYDDEIKTIISAVLDDHGFEVTITANGGEIILGRGVGDSILEALIVAHERALKQMREALDEEEADIEND